MTKSQDTKEIIEETDEKIESEKRASDNLVKPKLPTYLGILFMIFSVGFLGGIAAEKVGEKVKEVTKQVTEKSVTVQEQSVTVDVVKKVSPSVVSITSEQSKLNFFGQITKSKSAGTGFVASEDGLILTNKHVISESSDAYSVFTSDGKEFKARLKAQDPVYDIAFLKIEAKGLKPVELGDSDKIQVGQKVIAIGNALGQYQNTVTTGVVSAVGRAIEAGDSSQGSTETLENMIQTDAAINPGNSGGPLSDVDGNIIGINTAVAEQAQGIGFAIPINFAKSAIKSVIEKGRVVRPMIGVRYVNITKEFATRNDLSVDHGALIYASGNDLAVLPGSPAAKAGLKEGDIIVKIRDDEIAQGRSMVGIISKYNPGDKVLITYIRDGKEHKVEVVLAESK